MPTGTVAFAYRGATRSITAATPSRSSVDHTAARSPKRLCWVRTGCPVGAPDNLAATSSALPRYCWDTIRGLPPTRADSTR